MNATPPSPQYVTINEAATTLGIKPWDVVRLIETGKVQSVELVELASLDRVKVQTS